jgi:hypothetical protein
MPWKTLSVEDLDAIAESATSSGLLVVEPKGYRFINMALSMLLVTEIQRKLLGLPVPGADRNMNGMDLLQMMRYVGASFYGMLCPLVFSSWGLRKDIIVREVAALLFEYNHIRIEGELFHVRYYRGKRIMQPLESLDDIECFDEMVQELGSSFSEM